MDQQEAIKSLEKGSQFYEDGNIEGSLSYYKTALKIFKKTKAVEKEADTLLQMGDLYIDIKDYDNAKKHYEMSLKCYNKVKDHIGAGYALTGIGMINEKRGEYEQARSYYRKSIKKFKKTKDHSREAIVAALIANTYEAQEAWEDAITGYRKSSNISNKFGNKEKEDRYNKKLSTIPKKRKEHGPLKSKILTVLAYLAALIVAEVTTTYYGVELGLILHTCILFALLIQSSLESSSNFANLLRSMMVLPMIRIIGLSIPMMQIPTLYWYPIISIPLFAASYIIIKAQGLGRADVGLVLGKIPVQLMIASSGVFLGAIEYMILKPKPLISVLNLETALFAGIILLVATGFAEELLFRGIIQKNAENVFGKLFGLLYTALIFTSMHIGWNSIPDLFFVFGVAMFYGYSFQKTRSLFGVTLSHGLSNTFLFIIIPFLFM
ncbi:tetratricopeptide repeat protein [Methanobacterium paludis]|uniref:Abortive infection protein n=1 Tax=Methanobacterium paludis (strain DSM 25820 / JCM 18151 / SWAN1) TaxID=868131 RepID=F6D735_METPW|nr:tetratricopeptide repeat protein [Methanobacterium paludis]AEG18402.1 Abortive infection protein [Methanobacterium paludis]